MEYIKRIDLKRNYLKYKEEYDKALLLACENTSFSGGVCAERFDEEFAGFCGVQYATGVNNGTSALHCAMMALGVGEGDEVIVPANTFIATAWAPTYCKATPVFVDCTADTWEIDPDKIEEKITAKTKGIIGVHLYGQPFDFDRVKEIADRHGLFVVEDCAQAHGAGYKGKKAGALGDMGCFSFYPGKNLFCFGEGGSVTTNHKEYYDKINIIKNHGSKVRYAHEIIGYNMRLEGTQGAVLSVGLKHLDEWTERRRVLGRKYLREITNPLITMQAHPEGTETVFHLFVITVEKRDEFIEYMNAHGIGCDKHYPIPCHLQEAYSYLGYKEGDCPNAEYLAKHCVSLPMFPELTDEEADYIIRTCNEFTGK
ncbi:MAG: DegT/DnrJ/EryC1/StrS family aminotransferase [Thermoflexaceae bacterium]|nr:DegT/DnrJ/EryC1/StrS family aminotransferase [Thermoflexaceae bacterium]